MRTSPRLLIGAAIIIAFTIAMGLIGWLVVDGSSDRIVRTGDGRAISVGESWPGDLDACVSDVDISVLPNCYREPLDRGSFIKQPWSTYSTLAFCIVGLIILAMADRSRSREETQTPGAIAPDPWLGFVALFMGPGSALFHGTLTTWGGWGDVLSMYALLACIITCDLVRLRQRPEQFARWFVAFFAGAAVLNAVSGDANTYVFIAMGVGTGIFALVSFRRLLPRLGYSRSGPRLGLAYLLLFTAIVPWLLSRPAAGDPIDIPFHAAWHVLSATFVLSYWWYLRSERRLPVSSEAASGTQDTWPAVPTSPSSV